MMQEKYQELECCYRIKKQALNLVLEETKIVGFGVTSRITEEGITKMVNVWKNKDLVTYEVKPSNIRRTTEKVTEQTSKFLNWKFVGLDGVQG